jgi:DNA-binding transcriptional regulator YhcF (GntR family)
MTQKEAFDILKLGANAYITGPAGSGKTFLLGKFISYLKKNSIGVGVTASTGIAATHIGGVTIHSWSGLGIKESLPQSELKKILKKSYLKKHFDSSKVLVIDEISMINANQFDSLNRIAQAFKRNDKPFGGMQIVCSGDFFQLPPIQRNGEAKFVTTSKVWNAMDIKICYLSEQHRQKNDGLLELLDHIRSGRADEAKEFLAGLEFSAKNFPKVFSKLYTHNTDVDVINNNELKKINEKEEWYQMYFKGSRFIADTLKKGCLAPEKLIVKKGAKVMFVKNNFEAGYINGTLGKVVGFSESGMPVIKTIDGMDIEARPATWIIEEEGKIKAEIRQLPIRLAWAITVHKSQGMNLDAAEIDLSKSFVPGMGYVALSRLKSLNGLKLSGINEMALRVDNNVAKMDGSLKELSDQAVIELHAMSESEIEDQQKEYIASLLTASRKTSQSTYDLTKELVIKQTPVMEIAKDRKLSAETIVSHLEKLFEKEKNIDFEYLKPKRFKVIKAAFEKTGDNKINPVKDILGDSFSYLEIRLGRLFI